MKEDPYKKSARKYDIFVEPFNRALRQIGMGMYPTVPGMNVLDVGCGIGPRSPEEAIESGARSLIGLGVL